MYVLQIMFVLLDLQFICMFCRSLFVLQIVVFSDLFVFCRSLFVFSGVRVYSIFSLYVCFVDRCLFLVVFVLLDLQFYMYVLQIVVDLQFICMFCRSLFVFSGVRVTRSLVYMYVLQIVVCSLVYFSVYVLLDLYVLWFISLYVCFVDRCLFLVVCMFCRSLFVFSGVRVTRSLVYMYVLQIVVCFCRSLVYMYVLQMFVFSGVRVTRSLVYMYVLQIVVCFQFIWQCSCYLFDLQFICMFCRSLFVFSGVRVTVDRCLFLVVFVLLDLQFICMFCRSQFCSMYYQIFSL